MIRLASSSSGLPTVQRHHFRVGTIEEEGESSDAHEMLRAESPTLGTNNGAMMGIGLRESRLQMSAHSLHRITTAGSSIAHGFYRQDSYRWKACIDTISVYNFYKRATAFLYQTVLICTKHQARHCSLNHHDSYLNIFLSWVESYKLYISFFKLTYT